LVVAVTLSESDRSDLLGECCGISDLVEWLDSIDRRPGLSELDIRLSDAQINLEALSRHIGYAEEGYQRNIVKRNEHYELVAISWKAGQETPIHDHVGSDCAFLIVDGTSTETTFTLDESGKAVPTGIRNYVPGEVCATEEPDIHQISNRGDSPLINLHVYTPPLHAFNLYSPAD